MEQTYLRLGILRAGEAQPRRDLIAGGDTH